ncbi:hypothetical protein G6011_10406 [Alternaria panax]|uniref:Uncharacterized protein n=1 Tax=Alternaria panax TaxID=48097 RepID=A0AAD4IBX6_9PLEO|nr:hypothetical protein G6011_10406 [Alternaria panax]
MAPPTSWEKTQSCFFLFSRAKSTRWPNSTRCATDALLALSIIIAVAQFGLCIAMAHRLLGSIHEVQCWNVSSTGDFDFSGFGLGSSPSDFVFHTETKSLPLTYANLDKVFNLGRAEGNGQGLSGPEYLSARETDGTFTIVATLIFSPFLLVVDLLLLLRSHYRSTRISNRAGMLWSTCFAVYFLMVALGAVWLNKFSSSKIDDSYDTCWQYDRTMDTLEGWSRWAKGMVRGCEALGMLGALCMAVYFAFALVASYMNQRTDAHQSMRLDNLSSSSSTTHTDDLRDLPSSGLGTRAAPISMNNFGITFIDATPGAGSQPKTAGYQRPFEDQEVPTNPFADPEEPYKGDVGSQESVPREPGARK